jgi:hypothetical protein
MGDYLIAATGTVTVINRSAQGRGFDYLPNPVAFDRSKERSC